MCYFQYCFTYMFTVSNMSTWIYTGRHKNTTAVSFFIRQYVPNLSVYWTIHHKLHYRGKIVVLVICIYHFHLHTVEVTLNCY